MKVYLAGGMKSRWQDLVIAEFPGVQFIDPRSHGLKDERDYTKWDLDGIRACDVVFAYMDSENPSGFGLSLEVGFAHGIGKPVIYVCEDTTDRQRFFGMVRSVAYEVCDSIGGGMVRLKDFV